MVLGYVLAVVNYVIQRQINCLLGYRCPSVGYFVEKSQFFSLKWSIRVGHDMTRHPIFEANEGSNTRENIEISQLHLTGVRKAVFWLASGRLMQVKGFTAKHWTIEDSIYETYVAIIVYYVSSSPAFLHFSNFSCSFCFMETCLFHNIFFMLISFPFLFAQLEMLISVL